MNIIQRKWIITTSRIIYLQQINIFHIFKGTVFFKFGIKALFVFFSAVNFSSTLPLYDNNRRFEHCHSNAFAPSCSSEWFQSIILSRYKLQCTDNSVEGFLSVTLKLHSLSWWQKRNLRWPMLVKLAVAGDPRAGTDSELFKLNSQLLQ